MDEAEASQKHRQANDLYQSGKYEEALSLLDQLAEAFPNQKEILYPRARCLKELGRIEEARQVCDQLTTVFGDPRGEQLKASLVAASETRPAAKPVPGSRSLPLKTVAGAVLIALAAGGIGWLLASQGDSSNPATFAQYCLDGEIHGATWVDDEGHGPALRFDGQKDYAYMPGIAGMSEGTIQAWVRFDSVPSSISGVGCSWLVISSHPILGGPDDVSFGMHPDVSSNIAFGIYPGQWEWADTGMKPEEGKWRHYTGVWGPQGLAVYMDGELKGRNNFTGGITPEARYFILGANTHGVHAAVTVSGLRVYDRALSEMEVAATLR